MNTPNESKVSYRSMALLALIVGLLCIVLQFTPGWEVLAFMLSVAVFGGLVGGSRAYDERDRQQLGRSYKTAYEWLLLIVMAAYIFSGLSAWLHMEAAVIFINGHWPGLLIAAMCTLMGIAGLQSQA
ncbi:MAG: hypothetical protein WA821_19280 [Anaerolineales bacterium]